ncbi:MAG TPA: serine hydrolase domain-containing protein, partial [Hyphomonadaceae bacterium]|nr:serine hydrolase domain-containing protein [Hyphomonadaceae bacterium]
MSLKRAWAEIAGTLENACASGKITAASLALTTGDELHAVAAGMANQPEGVSATTDTLFHIGSVTKAMTAEIIWNLAEQRKLSVDWSAAEAAPELARISGLDDPRLTLRHLLSHTSGLDSDIVFDAGLGPDVLRNFFGKVDRIGALFDPGQHFSYSNVGYGVLGRVAELAGGAPFEEQLASLLRNQHGLTHFAIHPADKIRQQTAVLFHDGQPVLFGPCSSIASGTLLAMSMSDLVRWGASHASGKLTSTSLMRAAAITLPHNHRYEGWGNGFALMDNLGAGLFGHDGGTAGTGTFLRICEQATWAMSATGPGAIGVYREIEPMLRAALELAPSRRQGVLQELPGPLDVYEGVYSRHGADYAVSKSDDGGLIVTASGTMVAPMSLSLRSLSARVWEAILPGLGLGAPPDADPLL